ncbi:MAG: ParA family protein [Planctomycetes bacterium]|jgi:chromosome partitioning protein|nr:ParA family protein [Planctomycetota bacterium]MBT4029346.1 ParA family protein [Planctomycetota bacterium]MBT4559790.1 ParA family protein [Planctomycetota bacterium]MBT5102282.1 ParA family protein [Planctomycetota bacterium]MBT5120152.1 ParA family protein [Planctomycetota bacterium]
MSVISIINQKGGVGKTTSVANIGAALAKMGFKTLLIDLDPQAHLSISFDRMPAPGDPAIYSVLGGVHTLEDVAQPTGVENLWIAPTNLDLVGAETEFSAEIGREFLLRDALTKMDGGSMRPDVVLLDCPPSLGLLSLNALVASSGVVIPVQAEFFALQGLAQLEEVIQRVQRRLNPQLDLLGVLVGMFTKQRNLSQEVLQELHNYFGDRVFERLVRVNVRLAEAPSHGLTIFQYAPKSGAAEDFAALGEEFAKRLGLHPNKESEAAEPNSDELSI